jgi:hypothetical protein
MKRLTTLFHIFDTHAPEDEAMGVTLDVLAGIVAGLALVLAIFMLAAMMKAAPVAAASLGGPLIAAMV